MGFSLGFSPFRSLNGGFSLQISSILIVDFMFDASFSTKRRESRLLVSFIICLEKKMIIVRVI